MFIAMKIRKYCELRPEIFKDDFVKYIHNDIKYILNVIVTKIDLSCSHQN